MAAEPKILGHYRIERTLGKGAMGVVYEGLDMRLHRKVAIKTIIKAEQGDTMAQEYSSRFLREAQAVARLNHPNIVHVYDFGEEDDISFIVMEYINGRDLKSVFEAKDRFELKENLRLICELLDGLDFAHNAGVVHRDIKPANLMIDSQRRLKLTDFGVARLTDVERTRVELTQAGTMVGTPAYMSPEQVQGGQIDHRTDIFSAGVVLYQMLTGQKPFEGGAFTVAKRIVESEPPPPSSIERSLSPELDRIVARALAKLPEQRYSRAREMAQALRRAFDIRSTVDPDDETVMAAPSPAASARTVDFPVDSAPRTFDSPSGSAPRQVQSTAPSAEADLEFWRTIKDSNDADDMEFYVQKFPNGIYVDLAKRKITRLRGAQAAPSVDESSVRGRNLDEEFWRGVRDSNDPDEMEMYLERFPQGLYVDLAKRRIARMRRGSSAEDDSGMRGRNLDEELWRGVRDSSDPADIEHYLERFPQGLYVDLAKRRLAKVRREGADEESGANLKAAEALRRDNEDNAARRQAAEKAHAEAEAKREAEEKARRESEEQARREAEEKTRREAEEKTRREAEEKAQREAQERAKREAEAKAKREAEEKAKREAEEKARLEAQEKAKREAEAKAKREAEEKAKREAEEKARLEAQEKAKREAEARAKRDAEEKARREAEDKARREAEERAKREAEAKREADERARRDAEEKAKREAEATAKREADERAAKAMAKLEAWERTKREGEEKAQREAAERTRLEGEERARQQAQEMERLKAEEKARREAEEKAKRDAKEQARRETEEKSRRDAEEKARREAEKKTKRESETRAGLAPTSAVGPGVGAMADAEADRGGKSPVAMIAVGLVAILAIGGGVGYYVMQPKPGVEAAKPAAPVESKGRAEKATPPAPPVALEPAKKTEEAVAPAPIPEKSAPVPPPVPVAAEKPQERKVDDRAKREAEQRQAAEIARRASDEKARRDLAEKAKREAEEKSKGESAKRSAEETAKLDEERRAQQAKFDEERRKLKEEEQRLNDLRKRNEEAAAKQRQDAERQQKAEAEKQERDKAEKQKSRVFVPPTF